MSDVIRKEGLVVIAMDELAASLYAPEQLKELELTRPGYVFETDHPIRERYIVEVRRMASSEERPDGSRKTRYDWMAEIEHRGEIWRIPGLVMERIITYRDRIISEARSQAAKEAAELKATPELKAADYEFVTSADTSW